MNNIEKMQSRSAIFGTTTPAAFYVHYDGAASAATLAVASNVLTLTEGGAASAHDDGTSAAGTLDTQYATGDTIGELVDLINSVSGWNAHIVDSLRLVASASLTNLSTTSVHKTSVAVTHATTNKHFVLALGVEIEAAALTHYSRQSEGNVSEERQPPCAHSATSLPNILEAIPRKAERRPDRVARLIEVVANLTASGSGFLHVYSAGQAAETLLATYALTTTVERTIGPLILNNNELVSAAGERLALYFVAATPGNMSALTATARGAYGLPGQVAAVA